MPTIDEYVGGAAPQTDPGPGQPQGAPQAPAAGAPPEPLTKADLEAFKTEFRKDLLNVIRSQTGEAESKIKREVEAKLSQVETNFRAMKEAGIPVTDRDLEVARSQAISEAAKTLSVTDGGAQTPQSATPDPTDDPLVKQTNEAMFALQKQYGYRITASDPEFDEIPWSGSKPEDFLTAYEAKLVEINTRLGRPLPRKSVNPTARIAPPPGGAPAPENPIANITNPGDLIQMGLEEMRKRRS